MPRALLREWHWPAAAALRRLAVDAVHAGVGDVVGEADDGVAVRLVVLPVAGVVVVVVSVAVVVVGEDVGAEERVVAAIALDAG